MKTTSSPALRGRLLAGAALLCLARPPEAAAEVLLREAEALARAFPGETPERHTLYLTPEQVAAVEKAAHSKLPSAVITAFEAHRGDAVTGRAVLDTHVVRT